MTHTHLSLGQDGLKWCAGRSPENWPISCHWRVIIFRALLRPAPLTLPENCMLEAIVISFLLLLDSSDALCY